ncbi:c-type cytochrome [Dokdonella fugitiva]|jgi:cbb3-type cytochrome c oxidase subunit III|uniref:Cbb3-type cytochrome c oxidase subunit III n=1 Tax=Dokdonella fugitiva TaxID=328517 RepID=A0A4R2IF16_9GAMM|nr:c-type cytochrome [Dokdonella fugitiva]MBA8883522.1 cbb3-type cytochrome c oxidase subunit III [Dokdonella fugitiva]TCO41265.1 cbb3-type cytochrome c oxidase subunit III [Dokdonella fugitiva]
MSFRRVFVQSLLAVTALAAGAAQAQTAPSEAAAAAPEAAPAHAGPILGDAKAGEAKAAVCGACHGIDGNPTDKQYPKLAGQNEAYIARQLALFKGQKRQNPIMLGFAAPLSEQDMHDVGAYFAGKAALPGVADDALVERGQALYRAGDAKLGVPACMACHGPDGRGMAGAGYPQLGGQWTDYVATKLKDWKAGTSWGEDANAKVMPAIAQKLGDADIAAVASYVEGLHTATGTQAAAK